MLRTVYDPGNPGRHLQPRPCVYKIDVADSGDLTVDMTLTAPNCPDGRFHNGRRAYGSSNR